MSGMFGELEVEAKATKVDAMRQLDNLQAAVDAGIIGPLDYSEKAWELAQTVAALEEFAPRPDFAQSELWRNPRRESRGVSE